MRYERAINNGWEHGIHIELYSTKSKNIRINNNSTERFEADNHNDFIADWKIFESINQLAKSSPFCGLSPIHPLIYPNILHVGLTDFRFLPPDSHK